MVFPSRPFLCLMVCLDDGMFRSSTVLRPTPNPFFFYQSCYVQPYLLEIVSGVRVFGWTIWISNTNFQYVPISNSNSQFQFTKLTILINSQLSIVLILCFTTRHPPFSPVLHSQRSKGPAFHPPQQRW